MHFEVPLKRGCVARVDCPTERLNPQLVRYALRDMNLCASGTFLVCFAATEGDKPFRPEAVPVSAISSVMRSPMGLIALRLVDGRMVIPTVPRDYPPAVVESLLQLAQRTSEKPRRLFFGRVVEELLLIDAGEIAILPKKLGERPSSPSTVPDEAS